MLAEMEDDGTRPAKRHGKYLDGDEAYGLLITDMTPAGNGGRAVIDFKPKWLCQSPSAPADARRCRTCALKALREANDRENGLNDGSIRLTFCPSDLVSRDEKRVYKAVSIILNDDDKYPISARYGYQYHLTKFFMETPILDRLRELQEKLDTKGVLEGEEGDRDLATAMTLRDCSLFLRIPDPEYADIEARLGDLDWKPPTEEKVAYWKMVETQLIWGRWYHRREPGRGYCEL